MSAPASDTQAGLLSVHGTDSSPAFWVHSLPRRAKFFVLGQIQQIHEEYFYITLGNIGDDHTLGSRAAVLNAAKRKCGSSSINSHGDGVRKTAVVDIYLEIYGLVDCKGGFADIACLVGNNNSIATILGTSTLAILLEKSMCE